MYEVLEHNKEDATLKNVKKKSHLYIVKTKGETIFFNRITMLKTMC